MSRPLYSHSVFPDNLKKLREDRNWTQKDLADNAKLPAAVISFYETGTRSPGIENLCAIANALKVAPSLLLNTEFP